MTAYHFSYWKGASCQICQTHILPQSSMPWQLTMNHYEVWTTTKDSQSFSCMRSLTKLNPIIGSGSSGGTFLEGKLTSHCSQGKLYSHSFSFSGSDWLWNSSTSVVRALMRPAQRPIKSLKTSSTVCRLYCMCVFERHFRQNLK